MDGKKKKISEFLSKLTGKSGDISLESLSSAQRARFISWAESEGINYEKFDWGNFGFLGRDESKDLGELSLIKGDKNKIEKSGESSASKRLQADQIGTKLSIGIDIQSKSELFPKQISDLKSEESILKIFALKEIAYAENKPDPYMTLTGIFCAKEAIIKASEGLNNIMLRDLELVFSKEGEPKFDGFEVSISHSLDFAISVAVKLKT